MLKPYPFTTQCPYHHHHHHHRPLPFPSNLNPKPNPSSLFLSPKHHLILCATKNRIPSFSQSQPSNRKILQLASILALNLNILPEPFNFLATEIARGRWTLNLPEPSSILNSLGEKKKSKRKRKRMKTLAWFVFVPICCFAGFWWWRVSELDVLVKALLLGLAGYVSFIRICFGKKDVKELILGFLFGAFLMMSCKLGKEDLKFWFARLRVCSPAALIVNRNNRNWKRNWRMSK